MLITGAAALMAMASLASEPVGYEPLIEGRDSAAIEELQSNTELEEDDLVRLINLGVAYARQGREEEARAMFEAAMRSDDREVLETANGEWKDSRHLARLALQMLDADEFTPAPGRVIIRQASAD